MDDSVLTIRIGTPCFQGASAGVHGYNSCCLVVLTNTFLPSELKSFLSAFDTKGLHSCVVMLREPPTHQPEM